MGTILVLAAVLVAVWVLESPSFKGALGEFRVRRALHTLSVQDGYRIFHDLTLPTPDGTTQVDHVVVSRFGVFVIETKNMKGWIFGSADQPQWTQVVSRRKSKFQNPIRQNYKHVKAVRDLLRIEAHRTHGIVAFVGSATAKTHMPAGVVWGARSLARQIKSKRVVVITDDEIDTFAAKLSEGKLRSNLQTRQAHIRHVKSHTVSRRDPNRCPRCGAALVERTNRRSGSKFLACSRYPICTGTRTMP